MGTRSIIGFVSDGAFKASYNQYDGYPTALGKDLQKELVSYLEIKPDPWPALRKLVGAMRWVPADDTPSAKEREQFESSWQQVSTGNDWYSYLRDHQESLLKRLEAGIATDDSLFPRDSLFCEWGYVLDVDEEVICILKGFNTSPHLQWTHCVASSARPIPDSDAYYGCSLAWSGTLPEFLVLDMAKLEESQD